VTDIGAIYSQDYYNGKGADPYVDYVFELEHPEQTIRRYEWRGLLRILRSLTSLNPETTWLDFGCGNGGLVRYAHERGLRQVVGFEEGWITDQARNRDIPILERQQLNEYAGRCDLVTAIEVLEHVADPLAELAAIRKLLKPGGVFFFTTGNARPFRERLPSWRYVVPEIHLSFYEPETLALALGKVGFGVEYPGYLPGYTDVITFKTLKSLRFRCLSTLQRALPWPLLARILDRRLAISAHPVGRVTTTPS
jgi:SAM-dependent methyltransferase